MIQARFAILFDGGFVTKKIQELHKRPATADDVVAMRDDIRAHEELGSGLID